MVANMDIGTIDLQDLGERTLTKVNDGRCDQLEIFLSRGSMTTVEIEKGSVKKGERLFDAGFSARSVIGKSVGFAYSSSLDERDMLEVIDQAISLTKVMTPDPDFHSLPEPEPFPKVAKKTDNRMQSLGVEEVVDMTSRVKSSAEVDPRIYSINASVDLASTDFALVNSIGISAAEKDTFIGTSASVVSKDNGEMASGFEFQEGRRINEIDFEWVGKEAARLSISSLGAKKTSSGEYPVVFGPKVTAGILSSGIASATSAENVQKQRSYLTGKLGENIGGENITVIDDGILDNGLASSSFDGEGAPRRKTTIIEKGRLKSYLHNSYTAKKDGVGNTGNASRGGGWDYRAFPSIGHTNLILKPGKGDLDELVSEVKEGILVLYTGDRPNLVTGELSAQVTLGFKIENGGPAYPVKQATIGISLIDLLHDVEAIGKDTRQISGVIAPTVRIGRATISGGT